MATSDEVSDFEQAIAAEQQAREAEAFAAGTPDVAPPTEEEVQAADAELYPQDSVVVAYPGVYLNEEAPLGEPPDDDGDPDPMSATMAQAEYTLRRLRGARHRIDEVEQAAGDIITDAQEWAAAESAHYRREVERAEVWLKSWMAVRIERDPKAPKTCNLPSGRVKTTAGSLRVEVEDAPRFLAWARDHYPELIRQPPAPPEAPDKVALRQAVGRFLVALGQTDKPGTYPLSEAGTAEAVPGVYLLRAERQFTVEAR